MFAGFNFFIGEWAKYIHSSSILLNNIISGVLIMNRLILTICILFYPLNVFAVDDSEQSYARFILQLSSNLNCDKIEIELVSQLDLRSQTLQFIPEAFAGAKLAKGSYKYGDVKCISNNAIQTFDSLLSELHVVSVSSGNTVFGGKLIIKQTTLNENQTTPDVLDNCNRNISRARGEANNACRSGVGVNTSIDKSAVINVYAPKLSGAEIERVRATLQVSERDFVYLPLSVS